MLLFFFPLYMQKKGLPKIGARKTEGRESWQRYAKETGLAASKGARKAGNQLSKVG
jgi:hypothetical protein